MRATVPAWTAGDVDVESRKSVQASPRFRQAVVATIAGLGLLAIIAWHPGTRATTVFTGIVTDGLAVAVGLRWYRASHQSSGRLRVGQQLAAAGSLVWAVAELLWIANQMFGHPILKTLSTGAYYLAAVLTPAAVACMAATRKVAAVRTALDGLIITGSLLYVSWATILGPMARASSGGLPSSAVAPLADVLIASMALIMLGGVRRRYRVTLEVTIAGMLVMLVADSYYVAQLFRGTYHPGNLLDASWFIGFLILYIGTPRADEIGYRSAKRTGGHARIYLPYVPFGATLVTAAALFISRHGRVEPLLYAVNVFLTVLIVLRQLVSLRDNQSLTRRLAATAEDLRHRAYHDPLTGLANRAMLLDRVERALASAGDLGLLYVDLDGFKPVNDTLGHAAGDRVLVTVAERLRACVPDDCVVARLGGDEFALLLVGADAAAHTERTADRVLATLGAPITVEGSQVTVGASIGITYGRPGEVGVGELIRHADLAMYVAKLGGRNRAITFDHSLTPVRTSDRAA